MPRNVCGRVRASCSAASSALTGAAKFDEDALKEFGNDPLNLLVVSSSLKRQTYVNVAWPVPGKGDDVKTAKDSSTKK